VLQLVYYHVYYVLALVLLVAVASEALCDHFRAGTYCAFSQC
jgi:hypothetical protein